MKKLKQVFCEHDYRVSAVELRYMNWHPEFTTSMKDYRVKKLTCWKCNHKIEERMSKDESWISEANGF